MNKQHLILSASSGRADLGGLAAVWRKAAAHPAIRLEIFLTGSHVARGADYEAAQALLPPGIPVHVAGADMASGGAEKAAIAMGAIAASTASLVENIKPDMLLVLGDRLDMLPIVTGTLLFNLPVGHIHGGELTLGAVDDRLRHAITKLSHLHFVSSEDAAMRVCRMGEEPWRIHIVGAPGLDSLVMQKEYSRAEFGKATGLPADGPFLLVTVHPETNSVAPLAPLEAVLGALDRLAMPMLITAANADIGGEDINQRLRAFVAARPWAVMKETLGVTLYANALRLASALVGNSSSGVIEAGLFGTPVVDVGSRQTGRPRGANVKTVASDAKIVEAATRDMLKSRYDPRDASIYGDAQSGARIVDALASMPSRERLLKKEFFTSHASFVSPWKTAGTAAISTSAPAKTQSSVTDVMLLVPMRGGSTRLPGKHLKPMAGRNLVDRLAATIRALPQPAPKAIVSTDDDTLAKAATAAGFEVPFRRPDALATARASSLDVALHALDWWKSEHGADPDILVLLQATTPFRDPRMIEQAIANLRDDKSLDAVIGVRDLHRTPRMIFSQREGGALVPLGEDRPGALVTVNGGLYAIRTKALRAERTFFPKCSVGIVMDALHSMDVDTQDDWFIAESVACAMERVPS